MTIMALVVWFIMLAHSSLLINRSMRKHVRIGKSCFWPIGRLLPFSRSTSNLSNIKSAGDEVIGDLKIIFYSFTSARLRACNSDEPYI